VRSWTPEVLKLVGLRDKSRDRMRDGLRNGLRKVSRLALICVIISGTPGSLTCGRSLKWRGVLGGWKKVWDVRI
jgi:hypothetical protein